MAFAEKDEGSWFIQNLVDVLRDKRDSNIYF